MRHQGSRACRCPSQPRVQAGVSSRRNPQRDRRGGDGSEAWLHRADGSSLSRGLDKAGSGLPGGWAGRAWQVSAGLLVLVAGSAGRGRSFRLLWLRLLLRPP